MDINISDINTDLPLTPAYTDTYNDDILFGRVKYMGRITPGSGVTVHQTSINGERSFRITRNGVSLKISDGEVSDLIEFLRGLPIGSGSGTPQVEGQQELALGWK